MKYPCFMIEPTRRVRRWLRRTSSALELNVRLCEPEGYHQACVLIEDGPAILSAEGGLSTEPMRWVDEDPRWPMKCDNCDYRFIGCKGGQLFYLQVYLAPDGSEVTTHPSPPAGLLKAPVGAMWYDDWFPLKRPTPDGRVLSVMTPAGPWRIDGSSSNGTYPWSRTGTPPNVTVSPSIHFVGSYHGWLRDGHLIDA